MKQSSHSVKWGKSARVAVLSLSWLVAIAMPARAAEWPKQITIVVPFPPGASNDTFARLIAQKLGPQLGATIIVDNKPGAAGSIGAAHVARSAPNGATLMLISSSFTGNSAIQPKLPFDPLASFVAVTQLAKGPMILAVGKDAPFNSVAELVDAARIEKGKLNFGTAGVGSINHMASELLNAGGKVEMTHVPYRGISNAITDLMSGQIQMVIASFPSIAGLMTGGKVRGLAVTSAAPSSFAPELPAVSATLPGYDVDLWWGIFAPAGLPTPMVDQLNQLIRAIIMEPDMRERFAQEGAVPTPISSSEFSEIVRADLDKWRKIARERNIVGN